MDKQACPLDEISLERGEISPGRMKILPYKHIIYYIYITSGESTRRHL